MTETTNFAEVWGSVAALRSAIAAGYVKPGRDERTTLLLAAEIDRLRARAERAEAERDALRAALSGLLDAHARNVLYGGDHWENARAVLAEAK